MAQNKWRLTYQYVTHLEGRLSNSEKFSKHWGMWQPALIVTFNFTLTVPDPSSASSTSWLVTIASTVRNVKCCSFTVDPAMQKSAYQTEAESVQGRLEPYHQWTYAWNKMKPGPYSKCFLMVNILFTLHCWVQPFSIWWVCLRYTLPLPNTATCLNCSHRCMKL